MGSFEKFRKLIRPLGAIGLTGAAAILVNRGLRASGPLPVDHVGGVRRRWQWRGHEIFATELGEGPPVLLVHGIYAGASSYEFRKIAPLLAKRHRVIAFDLLGCGLSEMPDLEYSAELFVEQIVDAMHEFAGEPLTLVASSLGAAFAIRAAARAQERVAHLVLSCPTGLGILDDEPNGARRAVTALLHSPVAGEAAFNGLASRGSLGWFLRTQSYASPASVSPEVIEHYYAVTHQPGARFVPAYFVGGGLNCDVARDLPFVEAPVLVLWGERASKTSPLEKAHEFVRLAKDAQLVTLSASGLLPLEEEPEKSCEAIEAFVAPAPPAAVAPSDLDAIFKSYDVRGIVPGAVQRRHRVRHRTRLRRSARAQVRSVIGRDMRPSGENLSRRSRAARTMPAPTLPRSVWSRPTRSTSPSASTVSTAAS